MRIGIVGYGFVGKAMAGVFQTTDTIVVDPKYTSFTVQDLAENIDIVFICLPAPTLDDGSVDSTLISNVFNELSSIKFTGLVVLKSTVPPDTASELSSYNLSYIYSPEFLREAHWQHDALNPEVIILAGASSNCAALEAYYKTNSHILSHKLNFKYLDYKGAALAKYAINTYLASKVVFMNQLNQVYSDMYKESVTTKDWVEFVKCITQDSRIGTSHMLVPGPDGNFGYGGTCFPKDVKAMLGFDKNKRLSVLTEVDVANTKLRLL